ncbi:MAG: hypothetical protein WCI21_03895, partial [Alphaproteobacteria bacterium]
MTRDQARRLLRLGPEPDQDQVRAAYRSALKTAHPDQGGTEDKLRMVLEAYRLLDTTVREPSESDFEAVEPLGDRIEITPVIAVVGGRVATRLPDGRRVNVNVPKG